ncbi:MAG: hypothetical protein RLZZ395_2438, partial [Pseudomonadota bacterium]
MNEKSLVVVTGAARGIGEATVRKFASMGHAVAALDVNRERGEAMASELQTAGQQVVFHACDVADADAVDDLAARVQRDLGSPSVLVTSAALIPNTESIMEMDLG